MKFLSSDPQRLLTQHLLDHDEAAGFVGVGIGKTSATLAAVNQLLRSGESNGVLVLAPMRVANLTWPMEVNKWDDFRWMKVANLRHEAGKRAFMLGKAQIYVCNYEGIPKLLQMIKLRRDKGLGLPYDTLAIDECFAAGTLVDTDKGKESIESLRPGDTVVNATGYGTITHLHENIVQRVVRLVIEGREVLCSFDHRFLTTNGWEKAGHLQAADRLYMAEEIVRMVRNGVSDAQEQTQVLRDILLSEMEDEILQADMDGGSQSQGFKKQEALFSGWVRVFDSRKEPDSQSEAHAQRGEPPASQQVAQGYGSQAFSEGRERATPFSASDYAVQLPPKGGPRHVATGIHLFDSRHPFGDEIAKPLQTGSWFSSAPPVNRSGWVHTQQSESSQGGCQENNSPGTQRVESVEVYESTDPRLDRFRSPDGLIRFYDLSVSGHPSYSVNGLLVHNCTKIKNPSGKRAQAYRAQVPRRDHKRIWALTGTPAPNSLLDLFAQIRFVDGGKRLGVSYEHFKQTYFKQTGYGGYKWTELPGSKDQIEQRIADMTLTLRSSEWLDIPETIVEDIEIPLGAEMSKEYRDFEKQLIMEVKGKEITAANAAALVSKLLQFTSGAIYDSEKQWHRIHDLKLKALEKLVKGKGPVLVACSFRHEQARIRQAFPQAKFFDDAKSAGSQMELLEAWNAGKVPMLVAHPKSVGHGLNLQHGGNVIVWFTLTYSREDYEQMIARLARRGQEDITYVYRLMCPDTVDYAVATVIEEKRATEDRLLTALQLLESYREEAAKPVKLKTEEVEDWI